MNRLNGDILDVTFAKNEVRVSDGYNSSDNLILFTIIGDINFIFD